MFDIGLGEIIVLAILGLLIFGPDRLPKAAADAAKMMRNVRAMASNARKDLADSAGMDFSEAKDAFRDIADLHPRNLVAGIFDDPEDSPATAKQARSANGSTPSDEASPRGSARFDPDAT